MKYSIEISKDVERFLNKHIEIIPRYISSIEILQYNPFSKNLDIKKLKGEKSSYRLRIGKYRLLYEVNDKEIIIYFFSAGSRGDVYKK